MDKGAALADEGSAVAATVVERCFTSADQIPILSTSGVQGVPGLQGPGIQGPGKRGQQGKHHKQSTQVRHASLGFGVGLGVRVSIVGRARRYDTSLGFECT